MRVATVSHSHVVLRQQLFFQEVARQGHEVLMISPGEWGNLRTNSRSIGSWRLETCPHTGGEDIYLYRLLGAGDLVREFQPDWLYIQAEPGSVMAHGASDWKVPKKAIFTWENIYIFKEHSLTREALSKYSLAVCGNPEAVELVKPCNGNTVLMLQVGVDTDHFQARPSVERKINVAYIGRATPEKGLPYLMRAWPTTHVLEYKDFRELPWWYSQVKVVVAYSQDLSWWREQAPNYVVLEALACGCKVVVSDTAAMKYWLEGCPGVVVVEGHDQPDGDLRLDRVIRLREGIQKALDMEVDEKSRQWVVDKFSNPIVARELMKTLEFGRRLDLCLG